MSAPNIQEIEWAISELKQQESSKQNYILLAALHICRDHMTDAHDPIYPLAAGYSRAGEELLGQYGNSDFLREVSGRDPAAVLGVMDELMDTLRVVNPRAYDSVMHKIQRL